MPSFYTKPKRWGNSLGITIPKNIVETNNLSTEKMVRIVVMEDNRERMKKAFGSIKLKRPTQEVLDEIDGEFE